MAHCSVKSQSDWTETNRTYCSGWIVTSRNDYSDWIQSDWTETNRTYCSGWTRNGWIVMNRKSARLNDY